MLHARSPMMMAMPAPKDGVWVDLGGGTGSNMEYYGDKLRHFSKVVLVDLTPSLAQVARKRVEKNGWGDFVEVVCGDATDENLAGLPAAGTVDVVTISYAVTMIPNWRDAIANAYRMLKPGGHLCVCDFTVSSEHQNLFWRELWKFIFSHDHVMLSEEHIPYLQGKFEQQQLRYGFGGFPYVPLIKSAWYYYIGKKK